MPSTRKRKAIPAHVERAVLQRDGGRCVLCGLGEADGVVINLDHHPVPWAMGGPSTVANMRVLCWKHNNELGQSVKQQKPVRYTFVRTDCVSADVRLAVMRS